MSQDIAKTKKGPMEYRLEGSGPTVMVLNGGHCSRESRLSHEQFANNGFSVLTPSRPGYDSTPSDPLTPVAYFCSCSVTASYLPAYLF